MIEAGSVLQVSIDAITLGERRRTPSAEQIDDMRKSLRENGLLCPIGIRFLEGGPEVSDQPVLVFGATRVAAAKLEGWQSIEAQILKGTDFDFRRAEIAENLHRGELTAMERDAQLVAYERLIQEEAGLQEEEHAAKHGKPSAIEQEADSTLSAATGRKKLGHRPKGAIDRKSRRTAAAQLGVNEKTLRRAEKVEALLPPVNDAARATGLDDNRSALLAVASEPTLERQLARVYEIAEQKRQPRSENNPEPDRTAAVPAETIQSDDQAATIIRVWRSATQETKQRVWRALREEMLDIERSIDLLEIPAFLDRRKPRSPVLGTAAAAANKIGEDQTAAPSESEPSASATGGLDATPSAS